MRRERVIRARYYGGTVLRRGLLIVVAIVLLVAGWWLFSARTPARQAPLVALDGSTIDQLRGEFNASADQVRLIALLSPT